MKLDTFEIEPNVFVEIHEDECFTLDDIEDVDPETVKKFERGDLQSVCIVVKTYDASKHVEGCDALGGVIIGCDDHKQEIRDAIDAHEMIKEAKADLQKKLVEIIASNRGVK